MIGLASVQLALEPSFTYFITFPPVPFPSDHPSNGTEETLVLPLSLGSGAGSAGMVMLSITKEYLVCNKSDLRGDQNCAKLFEIDNSKTKFVLFWQTENLLNDLDGLTISPRGDFLFAAGGPLDRRLMVFSLSRGIETGEGEETGDLQGTIDQTYSTELRSGTGPCAFHPEKPLAACHCYSPFGRAEAALSREEEGRLQNEQSFHWNTEPAMIRFFPLDERTGKLWFPQKPDNTPSSSTEDDPAGNGPIGDKHIPPPIPVTYGVNDIQWSPAGTLLAIAEGEVDDGFAGTNGIIRVFRPSVEEAGAGDALSQKEEGGPWECIYYAQFSQVVSRVVFSDDGSRIAFTYEDKIRIVDLATGDTLGTKRGVWPGALSFLGHPGQVDLAADSGRKDTSEEILFASEHRLTSIRVRDLEVVFSEVLEERIVALEVLRGTRLALVLSSDGRLSLYRV